MMDKQNGLAENLVDAVAKEATVQVAKWVVNAVKGAVAVVAVAIVALACALLSANPAATIALLALSFLLGLAIGVAVGWRRACKAKDDAVTKAISSGFDGMDGFEHVDNLDSLIERVNELQEQVDRILNRENFALMRLRGLSLEELGIIKKFMTQSGEVYLKVDDASVRKLADAGAICINADTYCPPDKYPFTLDDSLRSLLVEFPDTLEKAVKEAEAVKSKYSRAETAGERAGHAPQKDSKEMIA